MAGECTRWSTATGRWLVRRQASRVVTLRRTVRSVASRPSPTFLCAALLAACFLLQAFTASRRLSLTWDEPTFFASGYSYLTKRDYRMNPEAPPLMQQLTALPLLALPIEPPDAEDPDWIAGEQVGYARTFVYASGVAPATIALAARLPVMLLGAGLVLAIFQFGRRLYGDGPALFATAIAAFSPDLLAHSELATTDLGCAALGFLAVWALWSALRGQRVRDWALAGAVTGLALLAKFTSLLLGPVFLVLVAVRLARGEPRAPLGATLRGLAVLGVVCVAVVGAGYDLSFDPSRYLDGLSTVYQKVAEGYRFYLLGEVSAEPWWHYYLVAFALKTPLGALALLAVALGALLWRAGPAQRDAALFLLVPVAAVFLASCFDRVNLGVRRVLPAVPFLILFTAQALAGLERKSWARHLVLGLGAAAVVEGAAVFPNHLSFFNLAAGGPARGPYLLDDSNVDWGQGLVQLAEWQRRHPEATPLRLLYFGSALPEAWGVRAEPMDVRDFTDPRPGWYAVSAHMLAYIRKFPGARERGADWLERYPSDGRAGWGIRIYRFPRASARSR
jgi:4-amino-4-deoxy-L-arabinose transferase-like glycosyltransferase